MIVPAFVHWLAVTGAMGLFVYSGYVLLHPERF
ncbi:potassium-transporting ATPase subunit F [Nitrosomonas sp. HPC101]|nr:potassium-transporting ATPase subunit F [Nitrosomonas sp. HPC101]MXS84445.1 potassium-transporting ATPase subunit F [Nitrosomonas sp. HPC101]